jgi:diguanylate cyclase (GGDEF)-like protein
MASFRVRLVLVVVLAVLPGLAFILYSAAEQRRQALEQAKVSTARLTELAAAQNENLIEQTRQLLEMLVRVPVVIGSDTAACSAFLAGLAKEYAPRFTGFTVIEPDGLISCASFSALDSISAADRHFFQLVMETRRFATGEYAIGRGTGAAILISGYPVLGDAGEVRKIVAAASSLAWLNQFAAQAKLPPASTLTLLDHRGTVLVRYPNPEKWVGRSFPDAPLFRMMTQSRTGVAETEGFDDVPRLFEFTRLAGSPEGGDLYLAIGLAKTQLFAESDRILRRNLLVLAGLALLALGATWIGGDVFFLRRVKALMIATERIEGGDLSARTGLPFGETELDRLAQTFDRTAESLQDRTVALQRLNRVYAVLSGIEGILLRHPDRDRLFEAMCRIAVEEGKFRLATIHEVDPSTGELRVACQAGVAAREAGEVRATVEGADASTHGLIGAVHREGRDVVVNDLTRGPMPRQDVTDLEAHGFRSAAAFPIRVEERVVGVLSLYSADRRFFDDAEVRLLREVAADISLGLEYIDKESRLQYLANYDALTDLPNRALFEDRLTQAIAQARQDHQLVGVVSWAVVSMDEIIGTLGHAVGDRVLRAVASSLDAAVPEGSTVARLASDEFGAVFTGLSDALEVETVADRIIEQVPTVIPVDDKEVPISLRLGAAIYPNDGADAETLVRNAALARQSGTGAGELAFFSTDLDAAARRRQRIERELRHAIERNELRLDYQPVVNLETRELVAVEALLRWRNESLGNLSPVEFIPIAERMGLIGTLGEWILNSACRQANAWHAGPLGRVRINVNVSVIQLRELTFVDRVAEILKATRFDPEYLALGVEITESALMDNVDAAIAALRRLKELGLAVYVDDFGTGYSSLAYLRTLPIDWIKIDKSFVLDLPSDPDATAVTRAIVALGHSLGLDVVAEGIETEAQLASLRDLGCEAGQGFLFSEPISADAIERWYAAARRAAG